MDRDIPLQPINNIEAERIRGIHNDSSGKLWSIYLAEADEHDEEITELWRGEADSILVFTGLFSGVIATFLSISYSNLFPIPSDATNALLAQISLQLVNISNGLPSLNDATIGTEFTPPAAAIRVNVIWFLSLVLSIGSALNATLFQQWSRRYLELTRHRVAPHKRARTRAYMFSGIASFKMSRAVKAMPVLLHLSIFLFFAGLVDFLWDSVIRHWVLGFVSVFTFAYLALTVLPNLYLNCPYSTPLSELSWHLSHHLLLSILLFVRGLDDLFLEYLFSGRQSTYQPTQEPSRWTRWRKTVKIRIDAYRKWLKLGLQNRIMLNATEAPSTTDKSALSWTLTVLDDDREFEDFVARVPGFFDSTSVPDASSVMLSLMKDRPSPSPLDKFDPILGSRINDLLNTCVPGTSPLQEELRKNRLRVCMRTLWYFAREYNQLGNTTPLPFYVRTAFAKPEMTRRIQSEDDIAARLIGRCFQLPRRQKTRTGHRISYRPTPPCHPVGTIMPSSHSRHDKLGGGEFAQPAWCNQSREHRLPHVERDGHFGQRKSAVGSTRHIPNDARHSPRGAPSGLTERRAATRSGNHIPRSLFQRMAITSS
ncbi:hypothetical protein EDB87DRAFT_1148330 [Lactarius vividus]|nr:hypothetical protein EDB87DRAFT_1148330 [Lactarius vividus]